MISYKEFDEFMKKAERYCSRGVFLKTYTPNISDFTKELFKLNKNSLYSLMKSIDKYNVPILTDSERDYLKAVIKPFKDRVNYIMRCGEKYNYLVINIDSIADYEYTEDITFPYFIEGNKYVNMECDKKYTLEELGLED